MQVAGQLWQLVVVHAELPAHLAALKNYFLLAKGDFYHSFIAEVGYLALPCQTVVGGLRLQHHVCIVDVTAYLLSTPCLLHAGPPHTSHVQFPVEAKEGCVK